MGVSKYVVGAWLCVRGVSDMHLCILEQRWPKSRRQFSSARIWMELYGQISAGGSRAGVLNLFPFSSTAL